MNQACCTRPVVERDYIPVGKWAKIMEDMDIYTSGLSDSPRAIIMIYGAPGFNKPLLQGADLLASSLSAVVFVPDILRGNTLDLNVLLSLPDAEKHAQIGKWLAGPANLNDGCASLKATHEALQVQAPNAKLWAIFGYCWGGKLAVLASGPDTKFDMSGAAHPGMIKADDAKSLKIPHVCLLSGEDGTDEERLQYAQALKDSGQDFVFELFQDMVHGWMEARGDLTDEKVKEGYTRGYGMVIDFFKKHMTKN